MYSEGSVFHNKVELIFQKMEIKCTLLRMNLVERKTVAPKRLTEAELVSMMEEHRIGTDGSVPGHINNICYKRNYVKVRGFIFCNYNQMDRIFQKILFAHIT